MNRLDFVCGALLIACVSCVLAQAAIQPDYDNIMASMIAGVGIAGFVLYMWISRPFDDAPLSSLALFGFCVTAEFASLVSQTVQGTPFVRFLRDPVFTFSILSAVQFIAIAAQYTSRRFKPFSSFRDWMAQTFMSPFGVHDVPSPQALWVLTVLGFASLVQGGAGTGDVSGKALQALNFMVWMPFLILVYCRQFGESYASMKAQLPLVLMYALVVVGMAVARNARQLMFIGPLIATLMYMAVSVRELSPMPRKSMVRVSVAIAVGVVAVALLADLVTAMAVVREKRDDVKGLALIEETYQTLRDGSKIEAYREQAYLSVTQEVYDEIYLGNPLLGRLSETKFHDNMLYFSQSASEADRARVIDENVLKVVVLLPQPFIDFLDLKINKNDYSYSMGDVYVQNSLGMSRGGFITGSIWADALVIFGDFWPFVVFIILVVYCMTFDSMSKLLPALVISPIGFCSAYSIFMYGIGSESLGYKAATLVRDVPQKVLLFSLAYYPIRLFFPQWVYKSGKEAVLPQQEVRA
jgi:hypothetical protein